MKFGRMPLQNMPRINVKHFFTDTPTVYHLKLVFALIALIFTSLAPQSAQANCTNPANPAGVIRYHSAEHMMTYCDGTDWIRMGKDIEYSSNYTIPPACPNVGDLCPDGTYYAGLSPDGNIPLFVAASDISPVPSGWGSSGTSRGVTSVTTGESNTNTLAGFGQAAHPSPYACWDSSAHGYTDWYLPAKNELNLIWNGGSPIAGISTGGTFYSTSTEENSTLISAQRFSDGGQGLGAKTTAYYVRCVRKDNEGYMEGSGTCTNPSGAEGEIFYNSAYHVMQFCNGADWIAMGPGHKDELIVFAAGTFTVSYGGNLGGVTGADSICQSEADAAGLGGTFKAWIADSTDSSAPAVRFAQNPVPYKMVNGTLVANNWADLTDGTIQNPIDFDEFGVNLGVTNSGAWTNVKTDGTREGSVHCSNWTSNAVIEGAIGKTENADGTWTDDIGDGFCSGTQWLYCFEQYPSDFYEPGSGCVSPTGTEGELYYNTTYNTMQYCNGYDWIGIRGHKCDTSGITMSFTDEPATALSSTIQSDIIQISGMACNSDEVLISGDASAKFRVCADGTCSGAPAFGTTGSIQDGEYLQLQVDTSGSYSTASDVSVTIGTSSDTWNVTTVSPPKIVFVTSTNTYKGNNFGGVSGAHTACQTHADNATPPLSGTFKAWIASTAADDPESTHNHHTGEYQLVNGTKIADNWTDLTDGSIDNTINLDESGNTVTAGQQVWTGTGTNGGYGSGCTEPGCDCNNWSNGGGGETGRDGRTSVTNGQWTYYTLPVCNSLRALYCFEQ